METVIQGITVYYRDQQEAKIEQDGTVTLGEEILYAHLPKDEQYFRRIDHPFTDSELESLVDKTHQYTSLQAKWKELEDWRFENGVYAYINGILKFIPGSYWCYCNYWYLEDGEHPDYREDEREFAVFLEHCAFRTPLYGATRPKGRRQGATSFGAFFQWFVAGRKEHKNVGTVSFNDDAAKDVFTNMIMPGFKSLLPCFQAEFDSPDDGRTFLRFVKPPEKGKKKGIGAIKRQGLNSLIDFKPLGLNSYTNKRLSFLLLDEFGRWEKLDCNLYWSKVSKSLRKGKKKMGFAYLPTVVNPKDKGGGNYKRFYEKSDQREYGIETPTNCVIFIMYGTQCYAGCIDKFGESVIDDPIEPIMGNDGDWITEGSKTLILRERALLEGPELMEHRRDFPVDEYDIFAFETGQCEFNEKNFIDRIQYLEHHPQEAYWRQGRLYDEWDAEERKLIVKFADDAKGEVWINEFPDKQNNYSDRGGTLEPLGVELYSAGADTYRNIFAINGSDGAIVVTKKSHIVEGKEKGLYPTGVFIGRPKLIKQFNRQALLMCLLFGCKINFEIDAGTWFYEDFLEWNALAFLEWTPAVDLTKKNFKITPGTESANPFQLAKQLEVAKLFYDGNSLTGYNGNVQRVNYLPLLKEGLEYNHSERTPYHLTVAFMMSLLPMLGRPRRAVQMAAVKPKSLLPRFKIKMVS